MVCVIFVFKQKTAYEMRISDWISDVCSSVLRIVMPVPLALAATWDTALVERVHRAAAIEATSDGVDWTFSPMLDIARDPRWGRVVAGAGERSEERRVGQE